MSDIKYTRTPADYGVRILGLSSRPLNALLAERIDTLADLMNTSDSVLLKIPNLGRTSLDEIKKALEKFKAEKPDVFEARPEIEARARKSAKKVTLRQYYAGKALQGLMADPNASGSPEYFAKRAFIMADAMLSVEDDE